MPNIRKDKLKIRANVSALLIDTNLKEHDGSPGEIKRKDYQVVSGDTLGDIADKYNTTVEYLKSLNPQLESIHRIYIGDWIKVPIKAESNSDSKDTTQDDQQIPDVDLKKDTGTNQNGHPAEQISYDSDTTVYHIYHDGRIERENRQAVGYAAFIYYDQSGNKHYLGKTAYIKTRRWSRKGILGNGYVYLVCIGGDKFSDDVNDNELSPLQKNKRLSKYRKGNVGYNITINSKSKRYYTSGAVLASFLGALCRLGYDDISFNGASEKDGSPGGSISHINGKCIDVRYLRKDKTAKKVLLQDSIYDHDRTLNMVNTFYEFGFGRTQNMLSERFVNKAAGVNSTTLLPYCSHFSQSRHNNHLHMQGFKPNMKDIDVISKAPEKNETNSFLTECIPLYSGEKLNTSDYQNAAKILGCEIAAIKAVAKAETKADAFRQYKGNTFPSILFEAHKFRKHTDLKFDSSHPHLSAKYGMFKYGKYSAQYKKLEEAIDLDQSAALKACSWGKFQILGSNFKASGFSDVQSMVKEMFKNEKKHLEAFVNFVNAHSTMKNALQNRNWSTFASKYNGPDYKVNDYDTKMSKYYTEFKNNPSKLP